MNDLYTDQLKAMILAAGGNIDDLPDNLYSTLLKRLTALGGGGGGVGINPNLLINPDFMVNQYGASGTITTVGYFVDRWQLVSGSVTVNADGTLTLNGTIQQILEDAVGVDTVASSNAGTATYDDATKTFTLTANGEIIKWTKLEVGVVGTAFMHPDRATELVKCQRFYCYIGTYVRVRAAAVTTNFIDFVMSAPQMRTVPSIVGTLTVDTLQSATAQEGFTFELIKNAPNGTLIRATKTTHGLTEASLGTTTGAALSAEL